MSNICNLLFQKSEPLSPIKCFAYHPRIRTNKFFLCQSLNMIFVFISEEYINKEAIKEDSNYNLHKTMTVDMIQEQLQALKGMISLFTWYIVYNKWYFIVWMMVLRIMILVEFWGIFDNTLERWMLAVFLKRQILKWFMWLNRFIFC